MPLKSITNLTIVHDASILGRVTNFNLRFIILIISNITTVENDVHSKKKLKWKLLYSLG